MGFTSKDLSKLARKLAKTNEILYDAIGAVEDLVYDPLFQEIRVDPELMKKLAEIYKKLDNKYEEFVFAGMYEWIFKLFSDFASELKEHLK